VRALIIGALGLGVAGCSSREACGPDDVYDGSTCVPYTPGEPVNADVWRPDPGTSWQWQITGTVDTGVDVAMYDIDLFEASDAAIEALHDADRVVICYFSAGSLEDFRPDVSEVSPDAVGRRLDGWPDERWLDPTHPDTRALLTARLDRAVERGCDGVEPDNVTAYDNATGFPVSAAEQLQFNRFIADEAHRRGLSVGLKNDLEQLDALQPWFDWALNEECLAYDECEVYADWLDAGLAVFHTEYADTESELPALLESVCPARPASVATMSTLVKTWDLGPEWFACP
jgi:hypothetical protein